MMQKGTWLFQAAASLFMRKKPHIICLLESFRSQPSDLVIVDVFMPVMDGLEMLSELRQEFPGARAIAISGSVYERRPRFLEIAGRIGSVRTLAKPFTAGDVTAIVNETLAEDPPDQSQ